MTNYTCPMHPEVTQAKPGRCSKCGMRLQKTEDGMSEVRKTENHQDDLGLGKTTWKSYLPLFVIIGIIFLTSLTIFLKDLMVGEGNFKNLIEYFMIGFFLTFSGFKLMDLKGFAEGYYTYDLLAQKWFGYGYIYPFIELFFGLAMIINPQNKTLLLAELLVMTFSGIGVAIKLLKKEKFQCACLGTFLKVPLTNVTLIEDFGMAILAAILLLLK